MMEYKCEHCGTICESEYELDIDHRSCRLKAAFPGAYSEELDGLVTFDVKKMADSLGLFKDWVIDRNGELVHPLDGDLHFRVCAYGRPEIWLEIPVQVGNNLSSWTFHISEENWRNIVESIDKGLEAARVHLAAK